MCDQNPRHWLPREDVGLDKVWHGSAIMRQQNAVVDSGPRQNRGLL